MRLIVTGINRTRTLLLLLLLAATAYAHAASIRKASPRKVGLDAERLEEVDSAIGEAVGKGQIPGAVVAIVRHGRLAYLKAFGNRQTYPAEKPMTTDVIFDLASCSKPVSTAMSALILYDRGMLDLDSPVSRYLPGFDDKNGSIKVAHLMTHTSGLPAYAPVEKLSEKYGSPSPQGLLEHICHVRRDFTAGADFQYSCLNYITLQYIVERISGQSLRQFAHDNIFRPLGMRHTDYLPGENDRKKWAGKIAPTTLDKDGNLLCGKVHDPLARVMNGGISGNAGLFSTAEDLAVICAMLQSGGSSGGKRILEEKTARLMRSVPGFASRFGRTYGWDVSSPYASCNGTLLSRETYGHTGFTGTSIVIDPVNDCSVILLTNSVHPDEKRNGIVKLRKEISDIVASALIW